MKRIAASLLGLCLALPASAGTIAPEVEAALSSLPPGGRLAVVVHLRERADLTRVGGQSRGARRRAAVKALRAHAAASLRPLQAHLQARLGQGRVTDFTPFWVFNGFSVSATADAIRELAALPAVRAVTSDQADVVPTGTPPAGPPEGNVAAIRAPELWSLGVLGEGVVVATLDSGADASHPDLAGKWRGGAGGWFDPYGQHATPYDASGHGTWTLGVIVGGDAGGTAIGVAPGATWIAAKIFPDTGSPTATAIHRAFQWVLDPDGDPATDDAPDVVNNSWAYGAPGCNPEFQADLQALRAAGILPVFAAGNFGPGAGTSVSPANYPEALSVGATSDAGAIAYDSSRGPSACGGAIFPDVVAPGMNVTTADLFGFFASVSGTSIAAPHVAGVAALLASAFPATVGDGLATALRQSAVDRGATGPDATYGYGSLDARRAYDLLASSPASSPPSAANDAYTVAGGTAETFTAPGVLGNDADPDGQPMTAVLVSGPSHGTLDLHADGGFTYVPDAGFSGTDAFAYQASDGQLVSGPATVILTVTPRPPPSPPVASNDSYSATEDVPLSVGAPGVLGNDASPEGRALSAVRVSGPSHGAVTLQPDGSFTYTPAKDFNGADAFAYVVSDGTLQSAAATVAITVAAVNDRPVAVDDAAATSRGVSVTIAVLANDTDVDGTIAAGTVTITSAPRNGTASRKTNGTVVYTPSRRFTGTDSFKYTVKDSAGATSNAATVRVTVR